MNFKTLQENLRMALWKEVRNSDLTGTALARRSQLRQAHISNFLNRRRGLSLEAMDRVLAAGHLSVLDLLDPAEVNKHASLPPAQETGFEDVPLVDGGVAASAVRITYGMVAEVLKFPAGFLRGCRPACGRTHRNWQRFVALQAGEGLSMFPRLLPGATVLVDRHYNSFKPYRQGESTMFVIRKPNGGCTIRYIEIAGHNLILRPHNHAYPVEMLTLSVRRSASHYIVGRVAYVGMET